MKNLNVQKLIAELAVIVFGILIAFQVEEWRENRREQRDLEAALARLYDETQENLQICERNAGYLQENALSVQHVFQSLQSGEIIDGDVETFENGLINFGVVPDVLLLTTVAEEMIATGLLKDVENAELRSSIALLPTVGDEQQAMLPFWRDNILVLWRLVNDVVDFRYEGELQHLQSDDRYETFIETQMRVDYDFAELASSRNIKNYFFDAVDVHTDLWIGFRDKCAVVDTTQRILTDLVNPNAAK